ncbi:MAG: SdpI family protein [Microbacteriaceae bacterium]
MSPNDEVLLRVFIIVFPIVSGSAIVWTAHACASGRIKRNWAIGIRLPSTVKSEDAWLACHRRAQRALTGGGLAMIATGLAGILPLALPAAITIVGAGALTMLSFVLYAAVVGVRAARALNE